MAKEVITLYVDDLDGGPAERTVTFAWGGTHYEIDLSKDNIVALEGLLAPYVTAGRQTGRGSPAKAATRSAPRAKPAAAVRDLAAVREWARSAGVKVAERGRVSAATLAAYSASLAAPAADASDVASADVPGKDRPVTDGPAVGTPRAKRAGRTAKRTAAAAGEPDSSTARPRRTRLRSIATPASPAANSDNAGEESKVATD